MHVHQNVTSWPSWSPLRTPGKAPVYMCRSEPQMQVDVIFRMASNCKGACIASTARWSMVTGRRSGSRHRCCQPDGAAQLTSGRHDAAAMLGHPIQLTEPFYIDVLQSQLWGAWLRITGSVTTGTLRFSFTRMSCLPV